MMPEQELMTEVIIKAIEDYKCTTKNKGKSIQNIVELDRKDAEYFLFTDKLDKFVDKWQLDLDADYVRELARKFKGRRHEPKR